MADRRKYEPRVWYTLAVELKANTGGLCKRGDPPWFYFIVK